MNKILPFLLLFSVPVFAQDFCTRSQDNIKVMLADTASRISFENDGGLFNGGVCWWHSRLQRSSAYLVRFVPGEPQPSKPELDKILHSLRTMDNVVLIPGYSDFLTFSKDYHNEIQDMLNDWQKRDGFLNFEWLRGISGRSELDPDKMKERMDDVYRYYKNSPSPLWIMAQIKGVTSHSLLVLQMNQTENGYDLEVIDSNHPLKTLLITYSMGDRSLKNDKYTFVPYTGFQNDFRLITKAIAHACGDVLSKSDVEDGDIEVPLQY
jgi:hypothetical protein